MNQRLRPGVAEPVILMFSRRQVETCDVDEPLELLRSLTADRRTAIEFCGRISLVVDGYNDDPRELFEVPEVRAYIKRLDLAWPYWFFLLSQIGGVNQAPGELLVRDHRGLPGVTSVDMGQLDRSLARHFGAMHRLAEELKLPEEMCEEVAEGIVGMFQNAAVERIEGDGINKVTVLWSGCMLHAPCCWQ
ncbi:MAG: hypothetical protein IPJ27_20595 [Candidatus Accumulibacter sp.]|uniref:Uncharacterized protein n=1 Tax=Candidatus Accumulibacter proximus TaxID=2954385 RepID=A0A935UHQ3_9PROT|nr:hypothetical protein [Candidatus Accumulibacter proximus]